MALYKSVYYYYFLNPGTQFPGNEKNTLCNTEKKLLLLFFDPGSQFPGNYNYMPGFCCFQIKILVDRVRTVEEFQP